MELLVDSASEYETLAFGKKIGSFLSHGGIVAVKGELGSGKSVIVRGICEGLGIRQRTRSPSFTFMHYYRGPVDVCHMDLYRIETSEDLATLGWEEVIASSTVTLIEWAEKLGDSLPPTSVEIVIQITGEQRRKMRLRIDEDKYGRMADELLATGAQRKEKDDRSDNCS